MLDMIKMKWAKLFVLLMQTQLIQVLIMEVKIQNGKRLTLRPGSSSSEIFL